MHCRSANSCNRFRPYSVILTTKLTMRPLNKSASRVLPTFVVAFLSVLATAQTTTPTIAPATPVAAAVDLPKAEDLVAKSVLVTGAEAMRSHKSLTTLSGLEIQGMGIKGSVKTYLASPNRSMQVTTIPGIGEFLTGFDGTTGWMVDPINGPRLIKGVELAQITREADFFKDVNPAAQWETLTTTGSKEFNGIDCWVVAGKRGEDSSTLYFEKTTGLVRGSEMTLDSTMGKIPVVAFLKEYKDFSGVQLPSITQVTQAGQTVALTIESAAFDTVDETLFALPKAIASLLLAETTASAEDDDEIESDSAAPAAPTAPAKPAAPK